MNRGWPHKFERNIAIRSKTHRRKAALLKQYTQYKPLVSIIKEALMKKCNLIQNQPLPCQIFKEPLNPRINEQLLKTSGADVLSSWKNPRKT